MTLAEVSAEIVTCRTFMMRPGGFEPPTRGLEVRRSVR